MSRSAWAGAGLAVALLVSTGIAVSFGSAEVAFGDVVRSVLRRLTASRVAAPDEVADVIVWTLRLPRVVLAALVGGGLAVIGVAMQALVRNPLAEPYILGVSSGASAGVSLFYLGFLPSIVARWLSVPLAAFIGALAAMLVVYLVARQGPRVSTARLLLAGVAVSAFLAALTAFVTFASPEPNKIRTVLFLLLGSFAGTTWRAVALPALGALVGVGVLWVLARPLDALLTGEEPAQSLGVPVETLKRTLIVLSAFVTGLLVAASGIIGFVGLIVPHGVRFVVGVSHRRVVPLSFVAGALFLVWADLAARTLLPNQELPVGVLTALCGVPFFLVLLRRAGPRL